MESQTQGMQFLDWEGLAEDERSFLQMILYGEEQPAPRQEWSELPPEEAWQQPDFEAPVYHAASQQPPPVYPTSCVMLQSPGVLLGNLNLNVNANVQGFMQPHQYQQPYEAKERRGKPKGKRQGSEAEHVYMYSYVPHNTPQHAPLYISAQVPMYNTQQPVYYPHPHMYIPMPLPQQLDPAEVMLSQPGNNQQQVYTAPIHHQPAAVNQQQPLPMAVDHAQPVTMPVASSVNQPIPVTLPGAASVNQPHSRSQPTVARVNQPQPVTLHTDAPVNQAQLVALPTSAPVNQQQQPVTSAPVNTPLPTLPAPVNQAESFTLPIAAPVNQPQQPGIAAPVNQPQQPVVAAPVNQPKQSVMAAPVNQLRQPAMEVSVNQQQQPVIAAPVIQQQQSVMAAPVNQLHQPAMEVLVNQPQQQVIAAPVNQPQVATSPPVNQAEALPAPSGPAEILTESFKVDEKVEVPSNRFKLDDMKAALPPFKKRAEVSPAPEAPPAKPVMKSWASIVQSNQASPLQESASNGSNKPLARVSPFTPSSGPGAAADSPLAKTKAQMTQQDHMVDDPALYRLGEYLCRYQLDHRSSPLQPRGLTNRSNWCYVNATLQALLACPPFFNLMRNLPTKQRGKHKSATPIIDAVVEFMQEFSVLPPNARPARKEKAAARKGEEGAVIDMPQGPGFEPTCVYNMLASIRSAQFKEEGRQEDAEEFLSCLLNALNDEMLELMKLVDGGEEEQPEEPAPQEPQDGDQWSVMRSRNRACLTRRADFGRTPVSDIFRGQLCSHVQRKGEQQSENVQPFYTLQLDIEKARGVAEALEQMVDRDWLEGVTCSRTQQQVEAWQQVTLEELPPVLLLHLKWFDYRPDGCTKVLKTVDYTVDLRIDNKLMSGSKAKYSPKQRVYKLFAVVYHDGQEASKGHYITDAYHSALGVWVRYDDSQVRVVPEHVVTHPRLPSVPYILYYRRSDTMGLPSLQ